jgi:3-oxoacyl-(acyl-carrier-protein) synthase
MYLNSGESRNILAGGFDEMTEKHYTITGKTGLWKKEEISNLDLFNSGTPGTISGEGSGFFLLSNGRTEGTYCYIRNLKIEHRPDINSDKIIEDFCSESGIEKDEIDVVIHGLNGDSVNDKNYLDLIDNYFTKQINTCYKHLSGEWYTASVFAFWLGANIIRRQTIPEVVRMDYLAGDTPTDPLSGEGEMVGEVAREGENEREIKNLMIYHRGTDRNHSLILLTKC